MGKSRFWASLQIAVTVVAILLAAPVASLAASSPLPVTLPAMPLDRAVTELAEQTGLIVGGDAGLLRGKTSPPLDGTYTSTEALRLLLQGSGVAFEVVGDNAVTLFRQDSSNDVGPIRLDPVTVTARRTEELVQDVPGSVFVLPSQEIEESNIEDLEDIALFTPNLNVAETGERRFINISIRGISNLTGTQTSGPTVGVYLDEVLLNPTGSSLGIDPNLFDLERAEVLYGPQGTAFGRGTIGGAVNYVTRKPTEEFEAELDSEVGSHPDGMLRGVINGSLTGDRNLMARLVAFGRYDGSFIDTPNIGGSNDEQDYGARLSLRSQPTDRLTLDLAGSFDRTEYRVPNLATRDSIEDGGDLEFLLNRDGENRIDRALVTFRGAYDFDAGTLISNTSYLDTDTKSDNDADLTELDFGFAEGSRTQSSTGQEMRFESEAFSVPLFGQTSFLLGVNGTWADESLGSKFFDPSGAFVSELDVGKDVFDTGAFGEVRFRPIERLEVAVGGRFTYNEVEVSQAGFEDASRSFTNFSPKASLLYDWTDDLSTYALISTGFKAGGFNALGTGALSGREFDSETAINYEAGIKSRWFDDRLFVNLSAFALFYDDIQVPETIVIGTDVFSPIDNAASARSLGGELGIVALPLEGLQLNLNYGYADARFTDYEDSPLGDLSDEPLSNAPRHTLSFIADYSHPVFDDFADAFIRSEYSYTSSFRDTLSPARPTFDAYDVLNLRLGLRADRFDIEAFVENVFDETYVTGITGITNIADTLGVSDPLEVGTPRRFGVRARVRF